MSAFRCEAKAVRSIRVLALMTLDRGSRDRQRPLSTVRLRYVRPARWMRPIRYPRPLVALWRGDSPLWQASQTQSFEDMFEGAFGPAAVMRPRSHSRHSKTRPSSAKLPDSRPRLISNGQAGPAPPAGAHKAKLGRRWNVASRRAQIWPPLRIAVVDTGCSPLA